MKLCHDCHTENPADAASCRCCGAILPSDGADTYVDAYFKREERRERVFLWIHRAAFILCSAVYFTLGAVFFPQTNRGSFLLAAILVFILCTLGFILGTLHPNALFFLQHANSVRDIDKAEPSDWYLLSAKIGGYLFLAVELFLMLRITEIL